MLGIRFSFIDVQAEIRAELQRELLSFVVDEDCILLHFVAIGRLNELAFFVHFIYYGSCVERWLRSYLYGLLAVHTRLNIIMPVAIE